VSCNLLSGLRDLHELSDDNEYPSSKVAMRQWSDSSHRPNIPFWGGEPPQQHRCTARPSDTSWRISIRWSIRWQLDRPVRIEITHFCRTVRDLPRKWWSFREIKGLIALCPTVRQRWPPRHGKPRTYSGRIIIVIVITFQGSSSHPTPLFHHL
jgi:hypothetical protein